MDVGEVNGRVFINNASLGVYVHVTGHRNAYQSRLGLGKWPAMGLAMLHVFWNFPVLTLKLEDGHRADSFRTPFVFLGNNAYLREGVAGVQRKSLTEGKLGIVSSRELGRFGVLKMGFRILIGRFDDSRMLEQRLTDKARIEIRKRHVQVALDGELAGFSTPLEFRICPRALKVLAA